MQGQGSKRAKKGGDRDKPREFLPGKRFTDIGFMFAPLGSSRRQATSRGPIQSSPPPDRMPDLRHTRTYGVGREDVGSKNSGCVRVPVKRMGDEHERGRGRGSYVPPYFVVGKKRTGRVFYVPWNFPQKQILDDLTSTSSPYGTATYPPTNLSVTFIQRGRQDYGEHYAEEPS